MKGTVKTFDEASGVGTIQARDGKVYALSNAQLVRGSKPPRPEARIVFRVADGRITKARVVSYKRQADWLLDVADALLFFASVP